MVCTGCGVENRAGRKFCAECGAKLELPCPTCGTANAGGERFCGECGAALTGLDDAPAPHTAERRLVTVLFADLVGFTTVSEHRDPDDVREMLSRYFERCRTLIERYGGTVEKFIGDAVMAVWGTPVALEDDAERAVRAALTLTNAVAALGEELGVAELRVRAGVLTGRASVEVGAAGEGMVMGDTVNAASRLQAIASPGQVLVDDVTRRSSDAAIAYEDAGVHQVKGREQPIHTWVALRVVAGAGGARRGVGLEPLFVGRDSELQTLISAAEDSAATGRARLVTVLGDAGSGKSRLLWEFFKHVDGIRDEWYWHEGRCLSYGEGVAYWALAEMIRARAGIIEEEPAAIARDKLRAAVAEHVHDARERRLVEPRLAQLIGLEERTATEAADLFSGWRLFFERMAQTRPVILVFEDLQWAGSGLLDFIDYLLEWAAEYPVFILALGRPEVAPRRSDWGTTVGLEPLQAGAMGKLLDSVAPALPRDLRARILQSADGIPLYAVETVRMLRDRGALVEDGQRYTLSSQPLALEVPETLQALIAARLDNLDAAERGLLQDAAVLGMSFGPSALAAVSGRPAATVQRILDLLVTRQVLGRNDDARSQHGQYRFLQAIVRTVALGNLPRRTLKARHLAAAEYLQETSGEVAEIAEVLASHYLSAAEADPDADDADAIRDRARETLTAAGRRAVSLASSTEARGYFERAAALATDPVERAELLGEAGAAAARAADRRRALTLLGEAIAGLDAVGEPEKAARTRGLLAEVLIADNRLDDATAVLEQAQSAVREETVIAQLAARRAQVAFLTGDHELALTQAEIALEIADPRGLDPILADATMTKALALSYRHRVSEAGALIFLSLEIALSEDITEAALRAYFNCAELRAITGRPEDATRLLEDGLQLARERGNRAWERDLLAQRVGIHAFCGEWDEALAIGQLLRGAGEDESTRLAGLFEPLILACRDQTDALESVVERPVVPSEWHELAVQEMIARSIALRAVGRVDDARPLLVTAASPVMSAGALTVAFNLGEIIDGLLEADEIRLLQQLVAHVSHRSYPVMVGELQRGRALLHRRNGELPEAHSASERSVTALSGGGNPLALARSLLDQGTILAELGRGGEAAAVLVQARELFGDLGAQRFLQRAEDALAPLQVVA
jgi:class 3 adenylate cyclase/tetratricopeptide (TPR) repeat protein